MEDSPTIEKQALGKNILYIRQINRRKKVTRAPRRCRPQTSIPLSRRPDQELLNGDSPPDVELSGSLDDVSPVMVKRAATEYDFHGADIFTDSGWDTDLESDDEEREAFDVTGRTVYLQSCRIQGVVPASYFLRHMRNASLQMKHRGLGPHGVKPVAVALVSNTSVLKLNLTDNWLGTEGGTYVCDMLKENCYIYDLDLSDNGLGAVFAQRLASVLTTNSSLTHITLTGNLLDDHAAIYLAEAIMNTTKVEYLNVSRNKLGEMAGITLGPAISENSSIKHLDLSWNSIRRRGAVAIGQGIKHNVLMQKVNLSMNGLGTEGAKSLGDALKLNAALEELDITSCRIGTEGAVLLGKGLAVNENVRVLKMGKNPMQSAGCYAVCAAILKNATSAMSSLDFTDVTVNNDFMEISSRVREILPHIKIRTGNDGIPTRPKARVHPMVKLKNYIEKNNLRLVDFFNTLDEDRSMSVTREEFTQGVEQAAKASGIRLNHEEIDLLLDELDKDGDGEINYSELVMGHQTFTEKEKKMATTIMQLNNNSSNKSPGLWQQ